MLSIPGVQPTTIQHPHRCASLITKLKRMLHGRQRCLLRKQISLHAAHLETLRVQGRTGRVIKSIPRKRPKCSPWNPSPSLAKGPLLTTAPSTIWSQHTSPNGIRGLQPLRSTGWISHRIVPPFSNTQPIAASPQTSAASSGRLSRTSRAWTWSAATSPPSSLPPQHWENSTASSPATAAAPPQGPRGSPIIWSRDGRHRSAPMPTPVSSRSGTSSSWDIRRAFDSVPRGAVEISWTRLGVPAPIAHWLATMDVGGPTVIRSPWALHTWAPTGAKGFGSTPSLERPCTFHRDRGTPQGDVSSPHNWVGFFDIALHALHLDRQASPSPALGTTFTAPGYNGSPYTVGDMGYADDLVSTASTLQGLQRQADTVSVFALCFDMEISVSKLRLALFGGPRLSTPPALTAIEALIIRGAAWSPQRVEVRRTGIIKMLGMTFDIQGPQRTQAQATKLRLARASAIICAQRSVDNAVLTAWVSSLTRASYTAQFTPWSAGDLTEPDLEQHAHLPHSSTLPPRLAGGPWASPTTNICQPTKMVHGPTRHDPRNHHRADGPRTHGQGRSGKWKHRHHSEHRIHGPLPHLGCSSRRRACTSPSLTSPSLSSWTRDHNAAPSPPSRTEDSSRGGNSHDTQRDGRANGSPHTSSRNYSHSLPHLQGTVPQTNTPAYRPANSGCYGGPPTRGGGFSGSPPPPRPLPPFVTLQRWLGIEQRTWRPSPTIGQRVRPAGRTTHLCSADFAARSHRRVIVHLPAPHKVGTILTHFMDTYQVQSPLAHTGRTLSAPSWTPPGPAGHKTCGEISWRTSSPATDPTSPLPLDFPQLTIPQILSPGQAPLLDGLRPALAYASLLPCISLQLPSSHGTRRPCQGPSPTGEPTPARPRTLTGTGDPPPVIPPP